MRSVHGPTDRDEWLGVTELELPVATAYEWAVRPTCGAVVLFSGTTRYHAAGRDGVAHHTSEAYAEQVVPTLA
jgi:molybdopterin synthase catalytic subunit